MDESTQKQPKIRLFYDWLIQKYDNRLAYNERTETVELDGEVFDYSDIANDARLESGIVIGKQRAQELVRYLAKQKSYEPPKKITFFSVRKPTILKAIKKEPWLCPHGLIPYEWQNWNRELETETMLSDNFKRQVMLCMSSLSEMTIIKTPSVGSYRLKHLIENDMGEYISNGALLVAVIARSIPYKPYPSSPNAAIAISKNDQRRLQKKRHRF
ncbi:hypothetical protein [Chroococcus sp. FPU101]|uniref:hypothetical protein n=1 Tax=Chroococcus sp. FPU101 TaxID=1974212 RepID=UPI001A8E43CC|nr:hypothetical protein [Chroococcus sp. FPU101]GFE71957.1 hypothetical protein CFPU101_45670 [Chroococcus sp. FPU101]